MPAVRRAASVSPQPRPACEGHERTFDRSARPDYARQALAICMPVDQREPIPGHRYHGPPW